MKEGAGKTGCRPGTHGPLCERWQQESAQRHTGVAKTSGLPCAVALRLMSRSPRGAMHSCPRRLATDDARARSGRHITATLDASLRAPGPHDFAVRRSHRSCVRCASLTVARPAITVAPMWPTSTAVRPAFVTIAIRPSSLGRVEAMDTPFPNFGKVEYFCRRALTDRLGVLPVGQHNSLWPDLTPAEGSPPAPGAISA
ncbi:hypothetical protein FHR88_005679 [Bradyrhizobium betae]|nr:hypothetical protein [Bradyrhizobium betae]